MVDDTPLAGKGDEMIGTGKQVVGGLSGDEDLEAEGEAQKDEGKVKGFLHDVKDKIEDAVDGVTHHHPKD